MPRSHPYRAIDTLPHMLPIQVSGPAFVVANACSAGLHALVHAVDVIRAGMADAMIVIGADLLSHVTQAGFQRMTALDPQRCLPFDVRRRGTVLGEGAAALVLVADSEAAAARRMRRTHPGHRRELRRLPSDRPRTRRPRHLPGLARSAARRECRP